MDIKKRLEKDRANFINFAIMRIDLKNKNTQKEFNKVFMSIAPFEAEFNFEKISLMVIDKLKVSPSIDNIFFIQKTKEFYTINGFIEKELYNVTSSSYYTKLTSEGKKLKALNGDYKKYMKSFTADITNSKNAKILSTWAIIISVIAIVLSILDLIIKK